MPVLLKRPMPQQPSQLHITLQEMLTTLQSAKALGVEMRVATVESALREQESQAEGAWQLVKRD